MESIPLPIDGLVVVSIIFDIGTFYEAADFVHKTLMDQMNPDQANPKIKKGAVQ